MNTNFPGVENVLDHLTISPQKFFWVSIKFQDSLAEDNVKQILTKVK